METALHRLIEYLRIPSISTDPAYGGEVHRCAQFTATLLQQAGLANARLIEAEGRHPLVLATSQAQPGKPTLLLYGHYDVQPPDPLDEWTSPPFHPTQRGDNLYARGAADDKGLLSILIEAVRHYQGQPPVNIVALIEGEEESGGEHIDAFVRSHPPELANIDAAVICDTEMFAPEWPSICTGLRGIVYGEIHVRTARQDLHSGVYGGTVPNALRAAAHIITELIDANGVIKAKPLYAGVIEPTEAEKQAWQRLPFDEQHYRDTEAGVLALTGESDRNILERTWSRPSLEVHGIKGGFTGEGSKTVIPAQAVVKLSLRLVPNQDPAQITQALAEAIHQATPPGAQAEFKLLHATPPASVDPAHPFIQTAAQAMTETFGRETVFIRSGGSIPIVNIFAEQLRIPSVLLGFGLPDDNLHAPDEKLYLPNFHRGIQAVIRYLHLLA